MPYNFDDKINRVGSHSAKWDELETLFELSPEDGLAMWVADMDFQSPNEVNQALISAAQHGVNGYFGDDQEYKQAIIDWMAKQHNWAIEPDWIYTTSGLVQATALCIETFTQQHDGIILFTPVYHKFAHLIRTSHRTLIESPLVIQDNQYTMDLDSLEASLTGNEKMVILCSPHNPGGRVWTKEELRSLAEFCSLHELLLISDEVHHDLVYSDYTHTVMPIASPEYADNTIVLTAASKTFNLASAMIGAVIISNNKLARQFKSTLDRFAVHQNRIGTLMVTAGYQHGKPWLDEVLVYLEENQRVFLNGIAEIPSLHAMPLQGTYLAWVDFSGTDMFPKDIKKKVFEEARIAVSPGSQFGQGGEYFMRFNLATPRKNVLDAIDRLKRIFG
ncbi:pyridoxal phosphate-dependent aminotransferase [Vibrio sp.]|nr:pyridoxal phosphate-dependent aminotransferase [Vibrio sp.]